MKYTDTSFDKEGSFALIRVAFSSLFLAPFRLVESISIRIPFLPNDALKKLLITGTVFISIIFGFVLFNDYTSKIWSIWSNGIGIVSCLVAYLTIGIGVVLLKFKSNLDLDFTRAPKHSSEEDIEENEDDTEEDIEESKPDVRHGLDDKKSRVHPNDMVDDEGDMTDILQGILTNASLDEDYEDRDEDKIRERELAFKALESIAPIDPFEETFNEISDVQSKEDKELNKELMDKAIDKNRDYIDKKDNEIRDMAGDFNNILSRMNAIELPN